MLDGWKVHSYAIIPSILVSNYPMSTLHYKGALRAAIKLGVKAVKSWGQLNRYLSSIEARAGLKWTIEIVLVGPPIHEGSFCVLGAISRPTFID